MLDERGITEMSYDEVPLVRVYRGILASPQKRISEMVTESDTLKIASATRLRRAALHEARNGASHSVASCALQLGHRCGFQGTKWVARKDSKKWTKLGDLVDSPIQLRFEG